MSGEVSCPGDKSISQRILIIGALLNCDMEIEGFLNAEDPNSTLDALNKLGASISSDANKVYLNKRNIAFCNPSEDLNLGNSGTGARLLLGLISGLGLKSRLIGDHSLSNRPMLRVISPLLEMGANIESKEGTLPITTNTCNINDHYKYQMPLASAQVKSCLLLAALSSKNNIKITEPKVTRDHTERMIEFFGGEISYGDEASFGQIDLKYRDLSSKDYYIVPGDFSSASFIIVASILANKSEILIKNVGLNKTRSGLIEILLLMGANIVIKNKRILSNEEVGDIIIKSSNLNGVEVPENIIPNIIDEIPILSIAAAFASGNTIIKNAAELRVKESDRLDAISLGLSKLRINHEMFDDGLSILGTKDAIECDEVIDSFDDHRIAMSFLISGIRSKNGITVKNCKNIETSFPKFKDIMNSLGMNINEKN
tara:strand:+ start:34 stop:1317 length:1284 start_codon:yes stop_codon:yes gene_type:complete